MQAGLLITNFRAKRDGVNIKIEAVVENTGPQPINRVTYVLSHSKGAGWSNVRIQSGEQRTLQGKAQTKLLAEIPNTIDASQLKLEVSAAPKLSAAPPP